MSSPPDNPEPVCPRCRRRIAAWKLNHCVYCGEVFPADWKAGLAEPEGLKWAERPEIPPDAAKKLEMMKVLPMEIRRRSNPAAVFGLLSMPVFAVLFYMVYRIVARYSAPTGVLILIAGAGFLGYLGWATLKRS